MSQFLDQETLQHLKRMHLAYRAFVRFGAQLERRDLHYAYGLFLQSTFGDYLTHDTPLCVRSKCLGLRLLPPEPYFDDWLELEGVDPDVASEKFNEYMGLKAMEFESNDRTRDGHDSASSTAASASASLS